MVPKSHKLLPPVVTGLKSKEVKLSHRLPGWECLGPVFSMSIFNSITWECP